MAPPHPPPTLSTSQVITVVLKVSLFVLIFISMIVLVSDTATVKVDGIPTALLPDLDDDAYKVHFNDVYAYRYVLVSIVFALVYSTLQIALSVYQIVKGNPFITGDMGIIFDFYGDKVISSLIITGSAAGFAVTKDYEVLADAIGLDMGNYFDKAYTTASLLLFAFLCSAALSVISSYRLPKQQDHRQPGQSEVPSMSESSRRHCLPSPSLEFDGKVKQQEQQHEHQNGKI